MFFELGFIAVVFSSLIFLFLFLPACLLLYFACRSLTAKNIVLVVFSLIFYAWGEPVYVLLLVASAVLNYAMGLALGKQTESRSRKGLLTVAVAVNLASLAVFKYAGLLVGSFVQLTGLAIPVPQISLPIGISFFTFQAMSYVIDVYRNEVKVQRSYLKFLMYISMFPQLIAGPIVRYSDIEAQMEARSTSSEDLFYGLLRFATGLGKKILIADHAFGVCSQLLDGALGNTTVVGVWLGVIMFTFQIYFDFSGYSDMAIGLGRIMGFHFPENFNFPYISRSCTEFWRRWHMTLGSWFRDYIYIPMGGNRVPRARFFLNILTVWMLTGLWHGAAWNFVLWGLFFAVILLVEKLFLMPYLNRGRIWPHIYTMALIIISFILFDSAHLGAAVRTVGDLFGITGLPLTSPESLYYAKSYLPLLAVGILGATPLPRYLAGKLAQHPLGQKVLPVAEPLVLAVLLLICTAFLVDGSYNPFLYFRF